MQQKRGWYAQIWIKTGIWLSAALLVSLPAFFPQWVEQYYSTGLYPVLAQSMRWLTHMLPISVGDLFYFILIISLIINLIKTIIEIFNRSVGRHNIVYFLLNILRKILMVYVFFKLLWGLNYNRLGIAHQLSISKTRYTTEEVADLAHRFMDSLNTLRRQLPDSLLPVVDLHTIYEGAATGYRLAADSFPFLQFRQPSIKRSLFTPLADYMGFTGYYNPFTGEAQLRTDIPRIMLPYVACHEMAHQLGYASESEANFVGYLACSRIPDPYFRYSVYLELFSYAQREELRLLAASNDSLAFQTAITYNRNYLDTLVKQDRRQIRAFFQQRRNNISPAISGLYDQYLKLNQQENGIDSYDEVIGWMIGFGKR